MWFIMYFYFNNLIYCQIKRTLFHIKPNFALHFNNGYRNTAVGNRAVWANQTGERNTGVGYDAMTDNVTGTNNSVVGSPPMQTVVVYHFPTFKVNISSQNHHNSN